MATLTTQYSLTILLTTIGRKSLRRTLHSIQQQDLSNVQVVMAIDGYSDYAIEEWKNFNLNGYFIEIPNGPHNDWGHTPRNMVLPTINTPYIMHMDDDDCYSPNALRIVKKAIKIYPNRPHIFRMLTSSGFSNWHDKIIRVGNVSTVTIVHPSQKYGKFHLCYSGDYNFIEETCALYPEGPVWHEDIIVYVR